MPELDTDTARIVSKLVDLQARIADLNGEAEALKAELRALPPDEYQLDGRKALSIVANRRFDPKLGFDLVPEALRPQCVTEIVDPAAVKKFLAPALQEQCMVVVGKPKVVLA